MKLPQKQHISNILTFIVRDHICKKPKCQVSVPLHGTSIHLTLMGNNNFFLKINSDIFPFLEPYQQIPE